jgi:4-amino-4-deoxy-L-arabinose transferase-like glycosyltransferase
VRHSSWEWLIAVVLLLVAFWFRTYRLADVPPGLHHDDIKNVLLVEKILDGYWRVYYPENFGHEPLYHWLQALYIGLLGSGYPELRLLSVGISMAGLALVYALIKRLLGHKVALWTLAWQAVSLWPLFYSRRAIRGILLVPLAALSGYLFSAGLDEAARLDEGHKPRGRRWVAWALGGVALAACLYTYAGSRVLPLFYLLLVLYLALVDRKRLRARWRGIVLFFTVAAVLSAPLVVYLVSHPEERMEQISAPLNALRAGDARPLVENSLRVLGMFAFIGDPHWRQYVAERPVFEPLGAILFGAGIVLALVRWRRYGHAFILLWLPVALLPGMLSEGAPNFLRPIAALVVVYAFPALATTALLDWLGSRWRRLARVAAVLLVALLGLNAWRTAEGYFLRWPRHPDARFAYSTTLLEASRALDEAGEMDTVVLSGLLPADLDPALVESFLRRDDLEPRWADVRQALIYPAGKRTIVMQPDHFTIDPTLLELFLGDIPPAYEHRLEEGMVVFSLYPLDASALAGRLDSAQGNPIGWSRVTAFPDGLPEDWMPLEAPILFGDRAELLGYEVLNGDKVAPGDEVTVLTYWRAIEPGPPAGITFLHALGPDGAVVAGTDGFGAPPNHWRAGDVVVQVHRLALPGDLAPGRYPLELGWYERDTGARWGVTLPDGEQVDRVLLRALGAGR